ncbi:MAG: NADP-dependent oxidoreductase [Streptosporangiaceae bacterium]
MRAVVISEFGGPEQLRLAEAAEPVPGPGQVRIRVAAAGINPVDAGNRADGSWAGLRVPCILGYDVAGVVDGLGPGVTELRADDRVMAMTHFPDGAGGYAELVVVDAGLVAPIAAETSFTHAAATPLAAGTAEVVLGRLALPSGSRLLVLGGSGGVGLFLLQMGARLGIEAIGVGRPAMHERMRSLGAVGCVDYTAGDVAGQARDLANGPVDAVADLVGGPHLAAAFDALRPGGQIASIATPDLDLDPLLDANVTFHGVLISDDGARTRRLASQLADGSLRVVVGHELPLAEAAQAHQILEQGHSGGKIVLRADS